MKFSLLVFLIIFLNIHAFSQKEPEHFTFPAEFEKHEAIWMGWRITATSRGINKTETVLQIIKLLTTHVKVNLFVDNDSVSNYLYEEFSKRKIDKKKVKMFVFPNPYSNV